MHDGSTLVGRVVDVQGTSLVATLISETEEWSPTVTLGDKDILVGRLGSYILVVQGGVKTLAIVTRMTEQEKIAPLGMTPTSEGILPIPVPERAIRLTPLGTWLATGEFRRGVTLYPTTGAEVHVVDPSDLERIFDDCRQYGFDIGKQAYNDQLRAFLNPTSMFARHFAILGQTGSGKSWAVASIVQKVLSVMPKCHIVILDVHGEYSWIEENKRRHAFGDAEVRYLDATELEVPYWLMSFSEISDLLVDIEETTAHNQVAFLRDSIQDLRSRERETLSLDRVTVDTPVYFDVNELRTRVEVENGRMVPGQTNPCAVRFLGRSIDS